MRILPLVVTAALAGCSQQSLRPFDIGAECKGKFILTFTGGATMLGAGNVTISGDCGEGAYYRPAGPVAVQAQMP